MRKLSEKISYDEISKKFYCHTSRGVRSFIADSSQSVYVSFGCKDCHDKIKCDGRKKVYEIIKSTLSTQTFYCPFAKMEHKNDNGETEIWYCPFSKTTNSVATCTAENHAEATNMLGCSNCGFEQYCQGPEEDSA